MHTYSNTILCVDDDEEDRALLREAILGTSIEHPIIEAFDGVQALNILDDLKLEKQLPCLIVLDMHMPRLNGKHILAALQKDKELATIPVVLFTTSFSDVDKTFAEVKGIELITKPMNHTALRLAATKMLQYCLA